MDDQETERLDMEACQIAVRMLNATSQEHNVMRLIAASISTHCAFITCLKSGVPMSELEKAVRIGSYLSSRIEHERLQDFNEKVSEEAEVKAHEIMQYFVEEMRTNKKKESNK